jgi:hypothetical protein
MFRNLDVPVIVPTSETQAGWRLPVGWRSNISAARFIPAKFVFDAT